MLSYNPSPTKIIRIPVSRPIPTLAMNPMPNPTGPPITVHDLPLTTIDAIKPVLLKFKNHNYCFHPLMISEHLNKKQVLNLTHLHYYKILHNDPFLNSNHS